MRPTLSTVQRSLLALAALPVILTGCADKIVAPDATPSGPARATRNTADAAGQACAAIAAAHPGASDGDYAMLGMGGATFKVYCNNMGSAPATFLTLAISGPESGKNFGSWAGEYQHLWEGHVIETYYSRLRFDPATLLVDNNDLTFSQTVGGRAFGPGVYLYSFPYANAADCLGWPPSGRANIDLNGTPFSIDDNFLTDGWFPFGYVNGEPNDWGQVQSVTGKTVDLVGGGFCGGTGPSKVNGFTQFAFTGPGLSSPVVSLSASTPVIKGSATTITGSASHPDNVAIWTSWDLGDGSTGTGAMPSSHTYASSGTYTLHLSATDGATAPANASKTVQVLSCTEATGYVGGIISGMLSENDARPLVVSLDGVAAAIDKGNMNAANGKLGAFDNKVQAALNSGKIDAATFATLKGYSNAIRTCMGN